ncbi:MAG: response regulator [Deltaproteobacteria bacterium]|nr:response regulator [Deltaproteobacteria bacterium]
MHACYRDVPNTKLTVLLIEDDPDVQDATRMLLEDQGYAVIALTEADAALEAVVNVGPCVVLLDLSLAADPQVFIRALRSTPNFSGRVLLFSAGDRLAERAREVGADGVVAKPFDADKLLRELERRAAELTFSEAGSSAPAP